MWHLAAADPTSGGSWVSILIGVVGGGIPAFVAWWRSTRVARQRADDQAWIRSNETMARQSRELEEERKRADRCDRNLRLAATRVDRLLAMLDMNGIDVPSHLQTRPWEIHNGNGNPTTKEGS